LLPLGQAAFKNLCTPLFLITFELSNVIMAPRDTVYDHNDTQKRYDSSNNNDLIEGAGKIHLAEAQLWGKGIIADVKRTVGTHWFSEMINLNQKTVAVTLLMFITVIAPTLTFGAVYGKVTENRIGAIETILATAWVGCTYALVGGMPMVRKNAALYYLWQKKNSRNHSLTKPPVTIGSVLSVPLVPSWLSLLSFITCLRILMSPTTPSTHGSVFGYWGIA
jgi:hypothetical protein